jgi:ribonuclease BN (tRNA processing enzyme)
MARDFSRHWWCPAIEASQRFRNSSILQVQLLHSSFLNDKRTRAIQLADNLTPRRTSSGGDSLVSMRHILLDCGEGTTFQLVRLVGPAQASAIISALDFVWLSHAHADHHLGLLEVAREFFRMTSKPLKVFAPTKLHVLRHRSCSPGLEEVDAGPAPWLPLVSMWEGVPMQLSLCSELAASSCNDAAVAGNAASTIRKHVPSCELLGVTAARVDHR